MYTFRPSIGKVNSRQSNFKSHKEGLFRNIVSSNITSEEQLNTAVLKSFSEGSEIFCQKYLNFTETSRSLNKLQQPQVLEYADAHGN